MITTEQVKRAMDGADKLEIESRAKYWLEKSENEKDPKKRFEWLRIAGQYAQRFREFAAQHAPEVREFKGESMWASLAFVLVLVASTVAVLHHKWPKSYMYQAPHDFWRILYASPNGKVFQMQQVHDGKPLDPVVKFSCDELPWEAGITLKRFEFDELPDKLCFKTGFKVDDYERWYSLVRDSQGCPIVPDNCYHTHCSDPLTDHIVCSDGLPKF